MNHDGLMKKAAERTNFLKRVCVAVEHAVGVSRHRRFHRFFQDVDLRWLSDFSGFLLVTSEDFGVYGNGYVESRSMSEKLEGKSRVGIMKHDIVAIWKCPHSVRLKDCCDVRHRYVDSDYDVSNPELIFLVKGGSDGRLVLKLFNEETVGILKVLEDPSVLQEFDSMMDQEVFQEKELVRRSVEDRWIKALGL